MCYEYSIPFIHQKALNYHTQHSLFMKKKEYKCSLCKQLYLSSKELYSNKMNQHGENGSLSFIPPYIVNHENEELKQVYIYLTENYISGENCYKCKKVFQISICSWL